MAESVDAADLKSADRNVVRVQVPLRPPEIISPIGAIFMSRLSPCYNYAN